jgi:LysR family nitrogen assimilation transcriptional regulator
VTLTALGARILEHGDAILDRLSAAESDLSLFLAGRVGSIAVGTFQSVSVQLLPGVLQHLRAERPDLQVRLTETADEAELVEGLRSRRLDVAFLTNPPATGDIRAIPLIDDPFVVVSSRHDAYRDLPGTTVAPIELSGRPLVCETLSSCQILIEEGLRGHSTNLNVVFRTQDNAAVQAMVRSGVGHAVMASLAVDPHDPDVVVRALVPPIESRRISVAVLDGRAHPPSVDRFVEVAQEVAVELVDQSEWLTSPHAMAE